MSCPFALEVAVWNVWAIPLVALLSAGLGLLAGRILFGQRSGSAAPDVPTDPAAAERYWSDRRTAPRHQTRHTKVLIADPKGEAEPFEGWLLNRSLGGLGLSVVREVEIGSILNVRPTGDPDIAPWVQVEVRYCRLERGRWTLGCRFVDTLPSNSLVF